MIVKIITKSGSYERYVVDVLGGGQMKTMIFDPGPWSSRGCDKQVTFQTIPEGAWGISCKDFLKMARLTVCALIRDKYWGIKRRIKGNAQV